MYTITLPFTSRPAKSSYFVSGIRKPYPAKTRGAFTDGKRSKRVLNMASSPSTSGSGLPSRTSARLDADSSIWRLKNFTGW